MNFLSGALLRWSEGKCFDQCVVKLFGTKGYRHPHPSWTEEELTDYIERTKQAQIKRRLHKIPTLIR